MAQDCESRTDVQPFLPIDHELGRTVIAVCGQGVLSRVTARPETAILRCGAASIMRLDVHDRGDHDDSLMIAETG
jgi:hypothetical protein